MYCGRPVALSRWMREPSETWGRKTAGVLSAGPQGQVVSLGSGTHECTSLLPIEERRDPASSGMNR